MAWFQNAYRCPACEVEWQAAWSATCDDDCPECGAGAVQPHDCIDLTLIAVPSSSGGFDILSSPDDAEGAPQYRIVRRIVAPLTISDVLVDG